MPRLESLPISLTRSADAVGADAGFTVVWLHGEHDLSTGVALGAVIARAAELDNADVLVDLSETTFIDVSIVDVLVRAQHDLSGRGLSLHVRAPSTAALRVLRLCGVSALKGTTAAHQPAGAAPALGTWVDVPAQPSAAGEPRVRQIAPAARTREPAMAFDVERLSP